MNSANQNQDYWYRVCRDARQHLYRFTLVYAVAVLALWWLWGYWWFGINFSASLPYRLVLIEKHCTVARGNLVVFRFPGSPVAPGLTGAWFFKRVAGVAGDVIRRDGRNLIVNESPVGHALTQTMTGQPLTPLAAEIVPPGYFYMQGEHEQSFDSRYQEVGLIAHEHLVGCAYVVF